MDGASGNSWDRIVNTGIGTCFKARNIETRDEGRGTESRGSAEAGAKRMVTLRNGGGEEGRGGTSLCTFLISRRDFFFLVFFFFSCVVMRAA